MKFVHIADVHIGMQPDSLYPWGKKREKEIEDTFYRVIQFCRTKKVELLIIAGDLFHKQPTQRQLDQVGYLLAKLTETQVVIMAGNHDYAGHSCPYLKFHWPDHVHFLKPGEMERVYLPSINTYIYGQSYGQNNIREDIYEFVEPGNESGYHILVAHGGDKNNIPFDLVQMKRKKFDYIALGHIHKPQRLSEHMAYSGSLEPLDKTELGKHGFICGEFHEKVLKVQFVPAAVRSYIPLKFTVTSTMNYYEIYDMVQAKIEEQGKQNIYLITLTGKRPMNDEIDFTRLSQTGNIVELNNETESDFDYEKVYEENKDNIIGLYMKAIDHAELSDVVKKKSLDYGLEALMLSVHNQ